MTAREYLEATTPVYVLGPTARNGVTLVQRLLNSTGKVMVFGENTALTEAVPRHVHTMCDVHQQMDGEAAAARVRFGAGDHDGWTSDLLPDTGTMMTLAFEHFARLARLYEQTAQEHGRPRWGVKTPINSPEVWQRLMALTPKAKTVFIYRDPRAVAASAKARRFVNDEADMLQLAKRWSVNVEAVLTADRADTLAVRYESLVAEPGAWIERMEAFVGVEEIDPRVMEKKVNTFIGPAERGLSETGYIAPVALTAAERLLIERHAGDAMDRAGYSGTTADTA